MHTVSLPSFKAFNQQVTDFYKSPEFLETMNLEKLTSIFQSYAKSVDSALDQILQETDKSLQFTLLSKLKKKVERAEKLDIMKDTELKTLLLKISNIIKNVNKKIQDEDRPSKYFAPSTTGRNFQTVTLTALNNRDSLPKFEMPYDRNAAFDKLAQSSLTDRCKVQIWFLYFKSRTDILAEMEKIIQLNEKLEKQNEIEKESLTFFLQLVKSNPYLSSDAREKAIKLLKTAKNLEPQKIKEDISVIKENIQAFSKEIREDINFIQSKALEFTDSPLKLISLFEHLFADDTENAEALTSFLDNFGNYRIYQILHSNKPIEKQMQQISKLLTEQIKNKERPILEILGDWHIEGLKIPHEPKSAAHSLKILKDLYGKNFGIPSQIYTVYAIEFLMNHLDPSGALRVSDILHARMPLAEKCLELGKVEYVLKRSLFSCSQDQKQEQMQKFLSIRRDFIAQEQKKEASHKIHPLKWSSLSQDFAGKILSSEKRELIAKNLHSIGLQIFLDFEPMIFEKGTWEQESKGWSKLKDFDERCKLFIFQEVAKAFDIKQRANIIGNWLLIAKKTVKLGNLNMGFSLYMALYNLKLDMKEAFDAAMENKNYSTAYDWLEGFYDFSEKYKNAKNFSNNFKQEETPLIPFTVPQITDLKMRVDHKTYSAAERICHDLFISQPGLRIWYEIKQTSRAKLDLFSEISSIELSSEKSE
ncbi:MAG: hypothetical protein Tsb0015_15910 [Simkaniaceae bacterium]